MKIDKLTPTELAQLGEKLLILLAGTELTAIEPHVRTNLIAAIGTKPADIVTQDAAAEMLKSDATAAFAVRDATTFSLLGDIRSLRDSLKAGRAPKDQFDRCSFDFSDNARTTYIAQTPTNLAVDGFSNGINKGQFKGNNKSGSVVYEIWRREGDEGAWALRMAVRPPRFVDEGVTPGQYYEYKVRAKASRSISPFSNSAVVYGAVASIG